MAVIALTSTSGSPGVTTAALGLAFAWPRPVLVVEADPTGGSQILAGYFRGARDYDAGLVELALSPYDVADALPEVIIDIAGSPVSFVAGTRSHAQAAALTQLWEPLAQALADREDAGQDVIVDCGRLGLVGSPEPLLARADLALVLTRTTLPSLAAARSWTDSLRRDGSWRDPGLLLVGPGQPYSASEVARVLGLRVVATVADDTVGAAVYSRGATPAKRFADGALTRSLRAAAEAITAHVSRRRGDLQEVAR